MIDSYINKNYYRLKEICKKNYSGTDYEDIFHEILVQMISNALKTEKLINEGKFDSYLIQTYIISYRSPTSYYQWKYNRFKYNKFIMCEIFNMEFETDENEYIDIDDIDIQEMINKLNVEWIYKLIFTEYIDKKLIDKTFSFRKMGEEGQFSENILSNRYNKVRNELKKIMKKYEKGKRIRNF